MTLAARHWHADAAAAALAVPAIASALSADPLTWEAIGTGGPCEAWSADTFDGTAQFWICCPDNTLGKADDGWLVGLQPNDEWNDHWQTSAPTMADALALVHAAHAARQFAMHFRADAPMTFAEFVASGRDVPNVGAVIDEPDLDGPGRFYAGDACHIDGVPGDWSLVIGNSEWSGQLPDLERRLYEYAAAEGHLTPCRDPSHVIGPDGETDANFVRAPIPSLPLWQAAFPDFPAADMPAIPAGWNDQSWHNDACPSFLATPSLAVFVDFVEPDKREYGDGPRFVVVTMENGDHPLAGSEPVFSGDDWQAVLDFVAAYVPPAPATPQTGEAAPSSVIWDDAFARQPDAVARLASAFYDVLREWCGTLGIERIRRANVAYVGTAICASHDECDANMAMEEACRRTFGAGPLDGPQEHMTEAAVQLWADAWEKANADYLTAPTA